MTNRPYPRDVAAVHSQHSPERSTFAQNRSTSEGVGLGRGFGDVLAMLARLRSHLVDRPGEGEVVPDLEVVDVPRRQARELVAQLDEVAGEVRVEVVEAVEVAG
jgi:hypothetical protein